MTGETLIQLALGDALALALLQRKGFGPESFHGFHPGGSLGAALRHVNEVMHGGDHLPLVDEGAPVIAAISELSAKGFGITGVTSGGGLAGVITDGDIRRYLEANSEGSMKDAMWETHARSLMTPGSIFLEPERLSARALHVLQSNKISAAFVIENDKPVGVVTLMQLLTLGVA